MARDMPRACPNTYGLACKCVLPLSHIIVKCMGCARIHIFLLNGFEIQNFILCCNMLQ